ncbi:putative membrane protein [Vibrio cholerae]|nr:putative membrane protein [Vibrio cholerae]
MNRSIYRQFVLYTIPTVAAMLVNGLYQVVDGIFIGHYVGAEGLAGINVAWPVIGTILGIGMLVGVGTGALASIKQGEGHPDSAKRILATGLMSLLLLAPIVAVILWLMADDFLRWQGAEGRVFELGLQYLQVLIVGCLFTLGSIAMPFLLRNDHSPNLATLLMVIGARPISHLITFLSLGCNGS